jgi:hypothetical protein
VVIILVDMRSAQRVSDAIRLVGRIADERRPPLDGAITVVMGALGSADRRGSITRMNRSA